jgi:IclR family KDG regulon transcriptional repressor
MKHDNNIKSLIKAMSVLKSFSPGNLELSPAEVAQRVKIPKPTAYRVLNTLSYGGLLEQNPVNSKYRIGPALYALGSLYLDTTDIRKAAELVVKTINDLTGEASNICILDKGNIVIVMKEESKHAYRLSVHIGSSQPAYASAMGKALLSEFAEAELDSLYPEETLKPLTRKTIRTKTELKNKLAEIKREGVAFAWGESYEGFVGIGAAIRDASGKVVAGLSVSVPTLRLNRGDSERLARLVKMGASLISYRLGYQDTDKPVRDIEEIDDYWQQKQKDEKY